MKYELVMLHVYFRIRTYILFFPQHLYKFFTVRCLCIKRAQ